MKYTEKTNIKPWKRFEGGEKLAIVDLMRIADTKTIEIYLDLTGERLYPIDFNVWGEPIFSNEVCKRILYEEECLKQIYGEDFRDGPFFTQGCRLLFQCRRHCLEEAGL